MASVSEAIQFNAGRNNELDGFLPHFVRSRNDAGSLLHSQARSQQMTVQMAPEIYRNPKNPKIPDDWL